MAPCHNRAPSDHIDHTIRTPILSAHPPEAAHHASRASNTRPVDIDLTIETESEKSTEDAGIVVAEPKGKARAKSEFTVKGDSAGEKNLCTITPLAIPQITAAVSTSE
jgi:hypothetical protein